MVRVGEYHFAFLLNPLVLIRTGGFFFDCRNMRIEADNKTMKTSYGIIWKILNELDLALDLPGYNAQEQLTFGKFKITENRFCNYLAMLQNAGYVDGVKISEDITGEQNIEYSKIKITLEGIQFLIENSAMQKVAQAAGKLGLTVAEAGTGFLMNKLA